MMALSSEVQRLLFIELEGLTTLHVFGIAIVALFTHVLYNKYATPLRKYPGPLFASFTRLWQAWAVWSGKAEEHYIEAHRKYGSIVRLGPNEISFASPTAGLEIFKTGKGFHKSEFYTVFLPNNTKDIFTEIRENVHAAKKRFVSPPYSLAVVKQQRKQLEEVMVNLLSDLNRAAADDQNKVFDLGNWIFHLTSDILAQFAFGQPFNLTKSGADIDEFFYAVGRSQYESAIIAQIPFFEKLTRSNPICKYIPFLPEDKLKVMPDTALAALHRYQDLNKKGEESPNCLLKSLLQIHEKNPDAFEMKDVLAVSMGAIAAGFDTTASTMHTFCWHVLSNPKVHQRLTAEILQIPSSELVEYEQGLSLPYFQACLKETMRLQPALSANITRMVPKAGAIIDGEFVPGGTQVAVNSWVMHRDETVFGGNTGEFDPDRWLIKDEERLKRMERCMFQFGGGSHVCIGRHLALFEMNRVLPQLFRQVEIKLKDPAKPLSHMSGLFYNQSGLHVYLRPRARA